MEYRENKTIYIYSQKLKNIIMEKGFIEYKEKVNPKYPKFKIFLFDSNEEIVKIVNDYLQQSKILSKKEVQDETE